MVQMAAQIGRRLLPSDPSPHLGSSPQRRFDLTCDGLHCTLPAPSHQLRYMETVISRIFLMAVENNEIKVQIQESAFVYTKKIE
ncbi:hypothetical protein EJB05_50640, partial [Eragrostis curvula]